VIFKKKTEEFLKAESPDMREPERTRIVAQSLDTMDCGFKYNYLRSRTKLLSLCKDYPGFKYCGATRTELYVHSTNLLKYIDDKPVEKVFWRILCEYSEDDAKEYLSRVVVNGRYTTLSDRFPGMVNGTFDEKCIKQLIDEDDRIVYNLDSYIKELELEEHRNVVQLLEVKHVLQSMSKESYRVWLAHSNPGTGAYWDAIRWICWDNDNDNDDNDE
jgi:uncharacterized protein with NAD-binding domain and iron-sulfur cluster